MKTTLVFTGKMRGARHELIYCGRKGYLRNQTFRFLFYLATKNRSERWQTRGSLPIPTQDIYRVVWRLRRDLAEYGIDIIVECNREWDWRCTVPNSGISFKWDKLRETVDKDLIGICFPKEERNAKTESGGEEAGLREAVHGVRGSKEELSKP